MNNVKKVILEQLTRGNLTKAEALQLLQPGEGESRRAPEDIAVVGMACHLPMSPDVAAYWDNLVSGRTCFSNKPASRLLEDRVFADPHFAEWVNRPPHTPEDEDLERFSGGFMPDLDKFDYDFFGIPRAEAVCIEPQQRLVMEQAWRALEDAGYGEDQLHGARIGTFVGRDGTNVSEYRHTTEFPESQMSGVWEGILASRLHYYYDLTGPAMVVDTACSSGLVAIHLAAQSLRSGECDMAVAAGVVAACQTHDCTDVFDATDLRSGRPGDLGSGDFRIHAFDAKSNGTVFSEGVAVVVLKPLSAAERDGDHIYGVLAASAVNSDGASNGLTAPNPRAQEHLLVDAWRRARINPEQIEYVETHGTGTPLGDPIEVLGLKNAFSRFTQRKQFCGIGSAKTNIGHTVGASGIAGTIKVLLSMKNEQLPGSLYFEEPNPHIDFGDSPLYVVDRNTTWARREDARMAGVSSFGFSGTNAHVVLRDHPEPARTEQVAGPHLFTVAAKTPAALDRYVDAYLAYLAGDPADAVEDICFTANRGRGHYPYRVAAVVESTDELRAVLEAFDAAGRVSLPDREVYRGGHRVVPARKTEREADELTEGELSQLSDQVTGLVAAVAQHRDRAGLNAIAADYVRGARVDFTALTPVGRRISLPTYPFARTECWGEPRIRPVSETEPQVDDWGALPHPLVRRCLAESMGMAVYEARLNPEDYWVVRDHVILGRLIIAGTVQFEMITEAARHHLGTDRVSVSDMTFLTPIVCEPDGAVLIHLRITEVGGREQMEVVSRADQPGAEWVVNSRCHIAAHEDERPEGLPTLDEVLADADLREITVRPIKDFGPGWQHTTQARQSMSDPEVTYGVFELPATAVAEDVREYRMHPGLMDCALSYVQAQTFMWPNFFLPYGYSRIQLFGSLPRRFYCRSRRVVGNADVMVFDVELISADGTLIGRAEQYAMKKAAQFKEFFTSSFHSVEWREAAGSPERRDWTKPVLVVTPGGDADEALLQALREHAPAVRQLQLGHEQRTVSADHVVAPVTAEGIAWALDQLDVAQAGTVIHAGAWSPARRECADAELDHGLAAGVEGLFHLTRALLDRVRGPLDLVVLADHAHDVTGGEPFVDAASRATLAMVKSLRHECPAFTFAAIDADGATTAAQVVAEAAAAGSGPLMVALRDGGRYEPVLVRRDSEDYPESRASDEPGGVILVTGGLGGLGSITAMVVAQEFPSTLCLAGRRPLPDRAEWDDILAQGGSRAGVIENIRALEADGARLDFAQLDVTDEAQVNALVERLRAEYGRVRAVIHCAGVAGDGFLFTKPLETFRTVMATKVDGLRLLHRALGDEPDLYLSFSSMVAELGGPGQSDYTAANSFLDAYTENLRKQGITARSINWPGWREIGMAVDYGVADTAAAFDSLTTQSGVTVLLQVLKTRDITNAIPGTLNPEVHAAVGEGYFPFGYSAELQRTIARSVDAQARPGATGDEAHIERALLKAQDIAVLGKPDEAITPVERAVACIYAIVIGIPEIDLFDTFTALGGNSIMATEVMRALNSQFDDVLTISDVFTYSTPVEMAEYIASVTGAGDAEGATGVESSAATSYDDMIDRLASGEIDADDALSLIGAQG